MSYYNMSEGQAEEVVRMSPAVKTALKRNAVYAKVDSVSRSGMSRKISLYIVYRNEIYCLNWGFGSIFGDRVDIKTHDVIIGGCGMDMLFEANYRLFKALCPRTKYQPYCRYRCM